MFTADCFFLVLSLRYNFFPNREYKCKLFMHFKNNQNVHINNTRLKVRKGLEIQG